MSATEASRGFSDLLDAVARGETVTVTRGGRPVAEIRPAHRTTGRDLGRVLGPSRLDTSDADEMLAALHDTQALLVSFEPDESSWADG